MGTIGNQNTWPPYDTYKDCSQGICSIYCPQWCYMIFPPPPLRPRDDEDDSGTNFSPLIIAVIGILASAFLLVSYYTIISKYCKRRRNERNSNEELDVINHNQVAQDQWQAASTGLDEAVIKLITVCKYKKSDGFIEGNDCSVCLSEFKEDESVRLLPKCSHAFHLPCIDAWLRSHSNCPLCRSNVSVITPSPSPSPLPPPNSDNSSTINISSLEIQRRNDVILVVDEGEREVHLEAVVVGLISDDVTPKSSFEATNDHHIGNFQNGEEGVEQYFRRSMSLGSFSSQRNLLIADILRIEEDDEDVQVGNIRSPMKRSISTGRFMSTRHGKGKNSIIPN